ncbi:MAG: HypC/HybG/HupF family hydrogenase formation chaperone [Nitrospirae bacterium]|nr:HypC/HybG/HupF family hydrogenase formation chaperone [Nitrospirota bacterium]
MCLGIPGRILEIGDGEGVARAGRVDFGGIVKEASLAFVPDAGVGDYVVVHVGFAIARLDEAEAARVFDYLRQMDELGELGDERG